MICKGTDLQIKYLYLSRIRYLFVNLYYGFFKTYKLTDGILSGRSDPGSLGGVNGPPCGDGWSLGRVGGSASDPWPLSGVDRSPCGDDVVPVPAPATTLLTTTKPVGITGTAVPTERSAITDGRVVVVHDGHVATAAPVHGKHTVGVFSSWGISYSC